MRKISSFNAVYLGTGALAVLLALRLIQAYWPADTVQFEKNELANNIRRSFDKRVPGVPGSHDIITGSTQEPKKSQTETKKSESDSGAANSGGEKFEKSNDVGKANDPVKSNSKAEPAQGETISVPETITGEKTLLERLAQRRKLIEDKEKSISEREALLAAAEQRLEQRISELKAADSDLKATMEAKKAEQVSIKPLVTMYETMKPKEAARIFEKIQLVDLLPIAQAMNPRKLSEILAQLDPAIAGKLTLGMTPGSATRQAAQVSNSLPELPDLPALGR